MFSHIEFTDVQKRAVYVVLASSIAIGSLFVTLSQGKASVPKATVSLPPVTPTPSVRASVVVDVAGKVLHPGVYTLIQGSRALDAIKAAGGQLKGIALTDINLAEVLSDGQQILVGAPRVVVSAKRNSPKSLTKSTKAIVNINSATVDQLQILKGIGPVTAQKVVAYRKAHGQFSLLADFKKASGMGIARYNAIQSQLRL